MKKGLENVGLTSLQSKPGFLGNYQQIMVNTMVKSRSTGNYVLLKTSLKPTLNRAAIHTHNFLPKKGTAFFGGEKKINSCLSVAT